MRQHLSIACIVAVLICMFSVSCSTPDNISRKEKKSLKEKQEKEAIVSVLGSHNFMIDVHTVQHAVNGTQIRLDVMTRKPEILFKDDGIHFYLPYFAGYTPKDGVMGNGGYAFDTFGKGDRHDYNAQIYDEVILDWSCPYPADMNIEEERGGIKMTFTTDMGTENIYFCEFHISRSNCDFTIDCKSFTKTSYRGHLIRGQ